MFLDRKMKIDLVRLFVDMHYIGNVRGMWDIRARIGKKYVMIGIVFLVRSSSVWGIGWRNPSINDWAKKKSAHRWGVLSFFLKDEVWKKLPAGVIMN